MLGNLILHSHPYFCWEEEQGKFFKYTERNEEDVMNDNDNDNQHEKLVIIIPLI